MDSVDEIEALGELWDEAAGFFSYVRTDGQRRTTGWFSDGRGWLCDADDVARLKYVALGPKDPSLEVKR